MNKKVNQLRVKLEDTPKFRTPQYRRTCRNRGFVGVQISRLVRSLELSNSEKLRLVGLIKESVEQRRALEYELNKFERKAEHTKKEYQTPVQKRHPWREGKDRGHGRGDKVVRSQVEAYSADNYDRADPS